MVFKNYYKILDLETSHVSIEEIKQVKILVITGKGGIS